MTTIVTRAGKGSPLTHTEVDTNFTNLNTAKLETAAIPLGTLQAPSVSFLNDSDTGIFCPQGGNSLAIATGAQYAITCTSTQAVGIKTANPQKALHVAGATRVGADDATDAFLEIGEGATGNRSSYIDIVGDTTYTDYGLRFIRNNTGANATSEIKHRGTGNLNFTTQEAGAIVFNTTNSPRVTILPAGNVGIGTSSPSHALTVNGAISSLTGVIRVEQGANAGFVIGSRSAQADFQLYNTGNVLRFYNGSSDALSIDTSGRVGIGNTGPSRQLDVNSTAIFDTAGNGTGNNPSIAIGSTSVGLSYVGGGQLSFTAGSTERARIDSSGRLLVGTSSAFSAGADSQYGKFQMIGNTFSASGHGILAIGRGEAATSITSSEPIGFIPFTDNAGNTFADISCMADANAGSDDYPGRLVFSTTADGASTPTERMRINKVGSLKVSNAGGYISNDSSPHEIRSNADNNNVLIVSSAASNGTQYGLSIRTANDQNDATRDFLECSGAGVLRAQIRSNGGLANYQANDVNLSDRNAKKDISLAAGTWDCIKEWEIVNYRYKDQPDNADLNLGVIAQQVAESCPDVITVFSEAKEATEDQPAQEERLGIKEQQMYWMAIKALQEAQVRIEALEVEVAALKAQ